MNIPNEKHTKNAHPKTHLFKESKAKNSKEYTSTQPHQKCKYIPNTPNLFGGGYISLPLSQSELNQIYEQVDIIPSHDHFYTQVIQKIVDGRYTGYTTDAFTESRLDLESHTIT